MTTSCTSLESGGGGGVWCSVAGLALNWFFLREVRQRERKKRDITIKEPNKMPITTHSFSPNIDVAFESSTFINAASFPDICLLSGKGGSK